MENKMVYVTKGEAERIKENAIQNTDVYLAEIDGSNIKTEKECVQALMDAFAIPCELPALTFSWCSEYIYDLMWIEQKDIVMLIHNYEQMLADDLNVKKDVMVVFEEDILPWWEGEVVGHMVGGSPRKFLIYLETYGK